MPGSERPGPSPWAVLCGRGVKSDDRMRFATSCPERLWLPSTPCHRDKPSAPSQALMDGSYAGFHTSPSSPEAVTRVIGVTSVDCTPSAGKTVCNRELRVLPLIVGARELLGTDPVCGPSSLGVTQAEAAGPAGPAGNKCKGILAFVWRMC